VLKINSRHAPKITRLTEHALLRSLQAIKLLVVSLPMILPPLNFLHLKQSMGRPEAILEIWRRSSQTFTSCKRIYKQANIQTHTELYIDRWGAIHTFFRCFFVESDLRACNFYQPRWRSGTASTLRSRVSKLDCYCNNLRQVVDTRVSNLSIAKPYSLVPVYKLGR